MRKNEIVYQCRAILMEETSESISMDQIALLLNCSKTTLFKHFESKKQLYLKVLEFHMVELSSLLMNLLALEIPAYSKLSVILKEVHVRVRDIAKSRIFFEMKGKPEFSELYFDFKSSVLEKTLEKAMKPMLSSKNFKRYKLKTRYFLNAIESRYFDSIGLNREDEVFILELNQMYQPMITLVNSNVLS